MASVASAPKNGVRVVLGGRYTGNLHVVRYIDLLRADELLVTSDAYTSGLTLKRYEEIALLDVEEMAQRFGDRLTLPEASFLTRYRFALLIEDGEGQVDARWFDSLDDLERVWAEAQRVAREDFDVDAEADAALIPRALDGSTLH